MALNTISPVARLELFLQDIADGDETPSETPVSRPEEFLRRIAKSNGEQDAALEHISDQIPIDPTSEDVGKVLTVIEDTSGEDPVYKWSAEEASGALKPISGISSGFKLSDSTIPAIAKNNSSLGADNITAMINGINACANIGEQYRFIMEHINCTVKGRSMFPADLTNMVSTGAKTDVFYFNAVSEPFKIGVSGTDRLVTVTYSVRIRVADPSNFITFDKTIKNLETSGQDTVASQNVTGIAATGNYMNFTIILYN